MSSEDQSRTVMRFSKFPILNFGGNYAVLLGLASNMKYSLNITKHFILQLTFNDGQVGHFLEELGAFLQGYLAQIDAVST